MSTRPTNLAAERTASPGPERPGVDPAPQRRSRPAVTSGQLGGPSLGADAPQLELVPGPGPVAPARRPRWYLEALVIVWLAWIYDAITNLPAEREHEAIAHGYAVLHLEQWLHLDPELALNHWLYHHPLLGLLAGDYYDNVHFIVTFGVVGWLWWRHPREYRPLRVGLVLVNVIGFVVYWLWPMAPLRLLPGAGAYDIVAITHAYGGWHQGILAHAANQFASMPSLHLAWAVWSAYSVWYVFRRHRWAVLVWIYPVVTLLDVLATANHFVLDCAAGVATVAAATAAGFVVVRRWDGWRQRRAGPVPAALKQLSREPDLDEGPFA